MLDKYITYNETDFLTDDYFVDSILHPTAESEEFWKSLIDNKLINVDEFISAYMLLKRMHESKIEVSDEKIDAIWNRIQQTNQTKKQPGKSFKLFRNISIAASIIGLISVSVFSYINNSSPVDGVSIEEYAKMNILKSNQSLKQIQIVTAQNTLTVDGANADVEYSSDGQLKVNKKDVVINADDNAKETDENFSQLRVPFGKRAFILLSDGTKLWVNAGSTVIYPDEFKKETREIFVDGEVFAEVFHNEKKPFIIRTRKLDVQVLGTVFNVTAYKEDINTNVVLVSGSVNVKPKKGKATLMKPNQLFSYTENASTLKNVDVEKYISWYNGVYIFQNEPIEDVLLRLARYYNVTMKLPTFASGITCSGKLELKDDLNDQLNGLSNITSLSYAVKDNEYRISFDE